MNHINCAAEFKFAPDAAPGSIEGYGSTFGNIDLGGDMIVAGAFKESLRTWKKDKALPMMLYRHARTMSDLMPLGLWTEMEEDDKGLKVKGIVATETSLGRDVYALAKMGAIKGFSIGYQVTSPAIYGTKPGEPRRTIKRAHLVEVSIVPDPMNPLARIMDVKSANNPRYLEQVLRDAGCSKSEAVALLASGFKAAFPRSDSVAGDSMGDLLASLRRTSEVFKPTT